LKRNLTDFFRGSQDVRRTLRKVLKGGAIASLGATTATAAPKPDTSLKQAAQSPTTELVLANRSQKSKKLILRMPDGVSYKMLQHRSHGSHRSHASHYSGSSGTAAPRPVAPPVTSTSEPVTGAPTAEAVPPTPETPALPWFTGVIERIDKEARTVTVKQTISESRFIVAYRDDTQVFGSSGLKMRLDEAMEQNNNALPFAVSQKVQIQWKQSPDAKKTIAVSIKKVP